MNVVPYRKFVNVVTITNSEEDSKVMQVAPGIRDLAGVRGWSKDQRCYFSNIASGGGCNARKTLPDCITPTLPPCRHPAPHQQERRFNFNITRRAIPEAEKAAARKKVGGEEEDIKEVITMAAAEKGDFLAGPFVTLHGSEYQVRGVKHQKGKYQY